MPSLIALVGRKTRYTRDMSQAAADSLVNEGDALFRSEKFGEAAAHFERAVNVYPHHALGWRGLGHALLCLGRPHDSARAFDQAIGLRPDSATALWGGALAHLEIGNKVIAKDYLRRSIALQPSWLSMAAQTPALAALLAISSRAADRLHAVFGPFSTRHYQHANDPALGIDVGRLANRPAIGEFTFVTIGLSNLVWAEAGRPHVELIMASTVDSESCAQILANLAFHLGDTKFFPEPGTMVRDGVAAIAAGDLSANLPHIYVQSPKAWNVELPLDEGPPAITLAQVFPISEAEYLEWRGIGAREFERLLFERNTNVADLNRKG
jgi:tetratricopeptide (TPR) repeat protein